MKECLGWLLALVRDCGDAVYAAVLGTAVHVSYHVT